MSLHRRTRGNRTVAERLMIALAAAFFLAAGTAASAQWPQWGGENRDFKAASKGLAAKWPAEGPRELWRHQLGGGSGSIAVADGVAYVMYLFDAWQEALVALDMKTGEELWKSRYPAPLTSKYDLSHGEGPRTTPLVLKDGIYTVGFTGKIYAWERADGKYRWTRNVFMDFGGTFLPTGYASSPIEHNELIIIQAGGGRMGFAALAPEDGRAVWKSAPFRNGFSSPIVVNFQGEPHLILLGSRGVIGFSAVDGEFLWSAPHDAVPTVSQANPVWGPGDQLFFPGSEGTPGRMFHLMRMEGKMVAAQMWESVPAALDGPNVIRLGDYLYGSGLGKDGKPALIVVEAATGKVVGQQEGFARPHLVYGDGKLIILDETGVLALATAKGPGLVIHSKVKLLETPCRVTPTLAGTTLLIRDRNAVIALDLKE